MIEWSDRTPRAWQRDALPVCLDAIRDGVRGVVHAVMGSGKSLLLAEVIARQPNDARILVTTPTIALVDQLHATISQRLGEDVGRVYTLRSDVRRVTIACVPSARRLLERAPDWDLWIADEAHRTECDSLTALELPAARLGMSATPYTGDGRGSLSLFAREIVRYDADDAIRDGVIVPPTVYPYLGDAEIPEDTPGDVALDLVSAHLLAKHNPQGPGIVNASSKTEAESVARWLTAIGWPALPVHSGHTDRQSRIQSLRDGEIRCLVHVSLLVEGVDLPWLRWILCRRRIASKVRFAQEVGRVLRAAPGKTRAIVLDPHDLFGVHDLAGTARLGELIRAADGARPDATGGGGPVDPESLRPQTVDGATAILRHVHRSLVARGAIKKRPSKSWHKLPRSDKQASLVSRLAWTTSKVPDGPWRKGLARACRIDLDRGDTARLIDVLLYLRKKRG